MRVLLVEDDSSIAAGVIGALGDQGFTVELARTGNAALAASGYDLVLLDLGLPDMDGADVCRALRSRPSPPAIIMLTARAAELDRVLGLELGADDYVTKPFSLRELVARLRAVGRRSSPATVLADEAVTEVGSLRIDRRTRRVHLGEQEVVLTATEFDILAYLAEDVGRVHSRIDIIGAVWKNTDWYGPTKTVDAHVASVRKKLGDASWIEAVRGVGFRLDERQ